MITQELKLKIHEEADLFSAYDPDQMLLSEDVVSYMERNYLNKHRSRDDNFIIHIYSDTPVNEESVKARFLEYFSQEKDNVAFSIKKLTCKQIYLAVIGVLTLLFWFFLSMTSDGANVVRLEIISIIGWVSIWEAASISIMQRPELVFTKRTYERMINVNIMIDVADD